MAVMDLYKHFDSKPTSRHLVCPDVGPGVHALGEVFNYWARYLAIGQTIRILTQVSRYLSGCLDVSPSVHFLVQMLRCTDFSSGP